MPSAPQILPTKILEGAAPGLTYRLEGELVPVLHMALDGQVPVYFEHHVLLWKWPELEIGLHPLKKGLKTARAWRHAAAELETQSAGERSVQPRRTGPHRGASPATWRGNRRA